MVEIAHEKGELTEKEVLDGVHSLGEAYMWMDGVDDAEDDDDALAVISCFERAKEGFECLLGEDSAEAVMASFSFASQLPCYDDVISEYRRLWETARTSLPNDPITFDIVSEVRKCEEQVNGISQRLLYVTS